MLRTEVSVYSFKNMEQSLYNLIAKRKRECVDLENIVLWSYTLGKWEQAYQALQELTQQMSVALLSESTIQLIEILPVLTTHERFLRLTDDVLAQMQRGTWLALQYYGLLPVRICDLVLNDGDIFLSRTIQVPLSLDDVFKLEVQVVKMNCEDAAQLEFCDFSVSLCPTVEDKQDVD